jgi:hypothetical protein
MGAGVLFIYRGVRWESLVVLVILVIFFIPIKRYTLPSSLPFNLEPYRIIVALVVSGWAVAMLVDARRVRLRRSGYEIPIVLFLLAAVFSWTVNPATFGAPGIAGGAIKTLTFFLSFVLALYVVVSTIRSHEAVDYLVRVMVACGALIGLLSLLEYKTGYNLFNHLGSVPFLSFHDPGLDPSSYDRGGRLRVYASAQHPIALAALLVMLMPLGVYLARGRHRAWWWAATVAIALGAFATVSRTAILMLLAEGLVLLLLRPREIGRLLPLLPVAAVVVYLIAPSTLKGLYDSFFPKGGLIAQQTQVVANSRDIGSRLARVGPSLHLFEKHPFLGVGFGTRLKGPILDDQWLDSLVETGAVGVAALIALISTAVFRLSRVAHYDRSPDGALAAALAASILSFGVGMITFDAFSFIQVTYIFFLELALGGVLLHVSRTHPRARSDGTAASLA